jgi:hypothetical protein
MSTAGDAPPEIEDRLGAICLALPDAYQEQAWVGTRWRVRTRTFAHVLTIEREWPPAHVAVTAARERRARRRPSRPMAATGRNARGSHGRGRSGGVR